MQGAGPANKLKDACVQVPRTCSMLCSFVRLYREGKLLAPILLCLEGWDGLEIGRLTPVYAVDMNGWPSPRIIRNGSLHLCLSQVLVLYTGSPNLNKGPKQRELLLLFEEFVPRPPNLPVKIGGDDEGGTAGGIKIGTLPRSIAQ